jgi:hypothetical protein
MSPVPISDQSFRVAVLKPIGVRCRLVDQAEWQQAHRWKRNGLTSMKRSCRPETAGWRLTKRQERHTNLGEPRTCKSRVEILEQTSRDPAERVELGDRAKQKRLMQHRGEQRVGDAVAGHIDQNDPRHPLAAPQLLGKADATPCDGILDARRKIEPLFEIDVDKVVAPDCPVQRQRSAEDIDALQARDRRLRKQVLRDLLVVRSWVSCRSKLQSR